MTEGYACIDPQNLSAKENYFLLTSLVVPRPIAWVSTIDNQGYTNLAPFSYFNGVCSDPALISISVVDTPKGAKDTLRGMMDKGTFCVNIVEAHHAKAMHLTSGAFEPDESEFEMANLESVPCSIIPGIRVADVRAALECRVVDRHVYGNTHKANLVIGEVLRVHLAQELLAPRRLMADNTKMESLARLGGGHYAALKAPFKFASIDLQAVRESKIS